MPHRVASVSSDVRFLEKTPSTKFAWLEDVGLRFLSARQSYGKETNYFEVLNPEVVESLNEFHAQGMTLPIFRGDDDIVIVKSTPPTSTRFRANWRTAARSGVKSS